MSSNHRQDNRNAARTRKRMPDKVLAGLRDIADEAISARRSLERAFDRAETRMDDTMMLILSRALNAVNAIERKSRDAIEGRYIQD